MGNANPQLPPFPLKPPFPPKPQNTSLRETYAPYEPLSRMDFYDRPSRLGLNIFSEALRKSDKVHQNLMENSLAMNHKLNELIELLESLPKETNEEDLAKHEKVPSVDEPERQPLPTFSSLDINLGYTRGTDPPINPFSLVILDKESPGALRISTWMILG
ncbi:hypothetical protein Tco_0681148 [Tanacetum coccineum]|uniref:Uncharacterized protein n=1 Tax=Tanacetum coccineum TaxID=301880 RepID=A0ABQ4XMU3_9ASTR